MNIYPKGLASNKYNLQIRLCICSYCKRPPLSPAILCFYAGKFGPPVLSRLKAERKQEAIIQRVQGRYDVMLCQDSRVYLQKVKQSCLLSHEINSNRQFDSVNLLLVDNGSFH